MQWLYGLDEGMYDLDLESTWPQWDLLFVNISQIVSGALGLKSQKYRKNVKKTQICFLIVFDIQTT